jgi:hypothetical protein
MTKHTAAGIPTWSPTVVQSAVQLLMYGRADGMPSFQLTVAVCTRYAVLSQYNELPCRVFGLSFSA